MVEKFPVLKINKFFRLSAYIYIKIDSNCIKRQEREREEKREKSSI
jgi:hypothetical protein